MNNTRMTKMYSLFIEWKESSLSFFHSVLSEKEVCVAPSLPSFLPSSLAQKCESNRASEQANE